MPMGIVSDSDFNKERDNLGVPSPTSVPTKKEAEIIDVSRGRGTGNTNVPDGLRKIIGEESTTNGRQSAVELASSLGISPSSVSAYGVGANSTSTYDERPKSEYLNSAKQRVAKKARSKMLAAMNSITKDKLEVSSAKDLAGIAKDMAAVVRTMDPEPPKTTSPTTNNGPQFIFYSPQFRKEEVFDVVHVKE